MSSECKNVETQYAEPGDIDLFNIYEREDELYETLQSFKGYQEEVNRELRRCPCCKLRASESAQCGSQRTTIQLQNGHAGTKNLLTGQNF